MPKRKTIASSILIKSNNDKFIAVELAEKECVDVNQDWENGETTFIFEDSSTLKYDGYSVILGRRRR